MKVGDAVRVNKNHPQYEAMKDIKFTVMDVNTKTKRIRIRWTDAPFINTLCHADHLVRSD